MKTQCSYAIDFMLQKTFSKIKTALYRFLRWSEKYTKADMVYIASGNFWLTAGRIVSTASGILLTIAFAYFFTPEQFGTYKYVLSIAAIIGALSFTGLGGALTRAIAKGERSVVAAIRRANFLWSIPASSIALIGAIYYFYNGNYQLGFGVLLIALTTPFLNNFGLFKSILLGEKDFRRLAYYGLPRGLVPTISIILALIISRDFIVVITTYFLSNLVMGWLVNTLVIKKYPGMESSRSHNEAKATITYGKHLSVMSTFSTITDSLDQLLLWHFTGPVQLAIYAFALAPIREIKNFTTNIFPLVFPKFAIKTISEMKETVPLRVLQLLIGFAGITIVYILFSPLLYKFIFPQYVSAIFASQLIALSLLFQPKTMVDAMLYAEGNTKIRYIAVFTTQGTKVVLWFILIPLYGLLGAVVGSLLADVISSLTFWWAYRKLK